MKNLFRAAFAAALIAAPQSANAASDNPRFPAIATGLAIPGGAASRAQALTIPAGYGRNFAVPTRGRAIVVDASSARLFMLQNGEVVDSMRVIVGKPSMATPILAGTIHYVTLNPYWNVPADLVQTLTARNVLKYGESYLTERGYEVVSSYSPDARVLPASKVDWKAVAAGRETVKVRQRPGPANSMGELKFGFANSDGIYLHDTPKKELFEEAERDLSAGCVRLEDAPRLARWMLGRAPSPSTERPEQHVRLPRGVPIFITYLDRSSAPVHVAALR